MTQRAWRAVLGCALGTFWSGVLIFAYPGVMGAYWREAFGVGASATGLVMTFVIVSLGVFTFFCGKWHMAIGTRKSFLIGTVVLLVAMLCVTFASNIYMVYVWAFLNGAASCFIYAPGLTTVQNWFPSKRGMVTGIVNLVFGISAAIMSPVLSLMMSALGYQMTNIVLMVLVIVTNVIAALLSEMPDRSGLSSEELAVLNRTTSGSAAPALSVTPKEALKTSNFWMIWLAWCFMGAAGISMVSLSTGYGAAMGLNGVLALTTFNVTNGLSRIVAGTLSDKIGRAKLGAVTFVIAAVGYAVLPFVSNTALLCICTACVGFAFGTLFAITAPLGTDLFGLKYFGLIFGLIFTAYGFVGGLVGPLLSSTVLDMTGSYLVVFAYLAVFCLLAACFIMRAGRKRP